MRRSKTAIKRLFGILMSMIMILGMMTTTAFAEDGNATITITKGENIETDWTGMTVNAYMVLDQVNDKETIEGKKQYAVTDGFKQFFNIAVATNGLFDGDNDNVYLNYQDNKITYSDQTSAGAISISDAKLDTTYKEADLVKRVGDANQTALFYTWIEKYIESKGASLTATKSVSVATEDSMQLVIDGLDEGYYALTFSDVPDGISVTQGILVATSGSIELKAEDLPLTKQVKPVDKADYAASATAALGEALEYKITSKVPTLTDYGNLTEFVFTDTLVRQVVDSNSFALKIGEVSASRDKNSFKIDNTVVATLDLASYDTVNDPTDTSKTVPGQKFTLTFETDVLENYQGKGITLTYRASLTADAVNVNKNHVSLDYTNGSDDSELTADTEVYTYGIEVQKTFSDASTDYTGVEFKLYGDDQGRQGTQIALVGEKGSYRVPVINTEDGLPESGSTNALVLDNNGKLTITGLDEGTYWLVETAAPSGFTVADPIQIVLAKDSESPSVLDKDNSTAKYNGEGDSLITGIGSQTNTQISLAQLTVLNQKGFSLPSTGGAGTWMLTIGGILLIAAAGGLYVIYRKKFAAK
ncbi:MAG: isopeptide-forming domain-containing fimbrial protein [Lacrimispora saccharolytica]